MTNDDRVLETRMESLHFCFYQRKIGSKLISLKHQARESLKLQTAYDNISVSACIIRLEYAIFVKMFNSVTPTI